MRVTAIKDWVRLNSHPLVVFGVALGARLLYIRLTPPAPLQFLPYQTDLRATQLMTGQRIFFPDAWASFYMVLAAFYEAYEALGLSENRVIAFVVTQAIMAALTAALVTILSQRFIKQRRIALLSGLIFSLYYPFLYLNTLVLSETTFVLAVVAALTILTSRNRSVLTLQGAGLLLGIALVSRPILTPFIPLALIWLVATGERALRLRDGAALVVPIVAVTLVASLVNALIGMQRHFSYNGNTGPNFAMAQCELKYLRYELPSGDFFWFSPPIFWDTDNPEVTTDVPFYETGYYLQMGLDCLRESPGQLARNVGHVAGIYHSAFYPNFVDTRLHNLLIDLWKIPAVLLTLAFFAYPLLRSSSTSLRDYWLFAALMVSLYASVYLASPGEERYLVSYFWLLVLFGLPAIVALARGEFKLPIAARERPAEDEMRARQPST